MLRFVPLIIAIVLSVFLLSCSKDDMDDDVTVNTDVDPISYELGESLYLDGVAQIDSGNSTELSITDVTWDGENLSLVTNYSGCENTPNYNVYWDGNASTDIYHMVIVLDDLGDCDMALSDTVSIAMDGIDIEEKPVEFIYAIGSKSTIKLNPYSSGHENINLIRTGYIPTTCTDTCAFELLMNANKHYFYSVNNTSDTTFSSDRTTLYTDWNAIMAELDTNAFFALDNDLTTADGTGTEWITVETKSQSRRVEFDYNSDVSGINNLVDILRSVRQDKVQQ